MSSWTASGTSLKWEKIRKLLAALPNDVTVDANDAVVDVFIKNQWGMKVPIKLPVRELNKLWTFVSDNPRPPREFLHYITTELFPLTHEERSKINTLSKTLSTKLNGLNLNVKIPNSLIEMLNSVSAASNHTGRNSIDAIILGESEHLLSVVVQVPELKPRHVEAEFLELLQVPSHLVPAASRSYCDDGDSKFAVTLNFSETVFEGMVNNAQVLIALVIVLKCYPLEWRQKFFWDAWLAITMQLYMSGNLGHKVTFPCLWIKQVFDAERLVSPNNVRHLLFGKDPVSKTSKYNLSTLCRATGIAFHAVGNDNPSIRGMRTRYDLNCDGDNPIQYVRGGLMMMNLIRCIGENDQSLSENSCRSAWIAYTLKIIHHFSCINKPVMVFTMDSSVLPEIYIPEVCIGDVVRVPHPSASLGTQDEQQDLMKVRDYLNGYHIGMGTFQSAQISPRQLDHFHHSTFDVYNRDNSRPVPSIEPWFPLHTDQYPLPCLPMPNQYKGRIPWQIYGRRRRFHMHRSRFSFHPYYGE